MRLPLPVLKAPAFWRTGGIFAALLAPIGAIWGAVAARRMGAAPRGRAGVPVVVVGNFTSGGAGKTPLVAALVASAIAAGRHPAVVTRGFGGRTAGPLVVAPERHDAALVGDEALLHAAAAPTVVARDRLAGAATARGLGADLIVLDDGFQSAALARDVALVVVDGGFGVGNGRVIPAGPLRAPLATQLAAADALVIVDGGDGETASTGELRGRAAAAGKPVLSARIRLDAAERFAGRRLLAHAGIGRPEKFAATLRRAGAAEVVLVGFGDHQRLDEAAAAALLARAAAEGLELVTTAKDAARLCGETSPALARLRAASTVATITLAFAEGDDPWRLVAERIGA